MIVRKKGKWCVVSETSGRSFGCYKTKKDAARRLRQVEFFKHLKSIPKARIRKAAYRRRK